MNTVRRHPALFLDRDGVINVEKNYVHRIEDFEFVPGIFELCAVATELGLRPVVVTNQAGIGRGYYTEADFQALTAWMLEQFRQRGIDIAAVYHCPYHPKAGVGEYRRESFDRKPSPGMLLKAYNDLRLDLGRSAFVGDKDTDMAAGRAAGVGYLVKLDELAEGLHTIEDVTVVRSLFEAAAHLRMVCSTPIDLSGPRR